MKKLLEILLSAAMIMALTACGGIRTASAYMKYNTATNEMNLYADIEADEGFDKDACLAALREKVSPELVPVDLYQA